MTAPVSKGAASVSVPPSIKGSEKSYQVIGKHAFKGINKKAAVKCPGGMKAAYRMVLLTKGMKKRVTFQAWIEFSGILMAGPLPGRLWTRGHIVFNFVKIKKRSRSGQLLDLFSLSLLFLISIFLQFSLM